MGESAVGSPSWYLTRKSRRERARALDSGRSREMREKNTSTRFACECNGCRNYPTRPSEIWHESQIPGKEQGTFYFRKDTMRLFSSRIVDFKAINKGGEINSLSVIVSSRHGYEGSVRYYEIVMLCPYGRINRDSKQFDTAKRARKEWDQALDTFASCPCHGCELDREVSA